MLDVALGYLAYGWSVIPANNKTPSVKWEEFQHRLPTKEEVRRWWKQSPNANIAVVTGKISNLAAIDFEKGAKFLELPDTVTAESGGGGIHKFFQYPKSRELKSTTKVWALTDIRAEGGIIILPPSRHPSGGTYNWIKNPNEVELAEFPEHLLDLIADQKNKKSFDEIALGVEDGTRNETAASVSGKLLRHLPIENWNMGYELLKAWNERNQPPLPLADLDKTFNSIKQTELNRRQLQGIQTMPENNGLWDEETVLWSDFCQQQDSGPRWRVDGLIPISGLGILAAPAGEKKTWFALDMARSISDGTPFLGQFKTLAGRVSVY